MPDPQLGIASVEEVPTVDYRQFATGAARAAGIDPDLVHSLIAAESSWNPRAKSPKGAIGLMQLMPDTARGLGVDPNDPIQNIRGGVSYLASLLDHFGGDTRKALAAYNAGPDAVEKHQGVPPFKETQDYVDKILGARVASVEDVPAAAGPVASVEDIPARPPVQQAQVVAEGAPKVTGGPRPPVRQAELVAQTPATVTEPAVAQGPRQQPHIGPAAPGMAIPPIEVGPLSQADAPIVTILKAAKKLFAQLATPEVLPAEPHVMRGNQPEKNKQAKEAISEILEATGQAASATLPIAAAVAPISTAVGVGASLAAGKAASEGVKGAGGSDEDARLAGDIVSTVVGAITAAKVHEAITKGGAAARANRVPVEPEPAPRPVGRGVTPGATAEAEAAQAGRPRLEAYNQPPEEPGAPPAPAGPRAPLETVWADFEDAIRTGDEPRRLTAMQELERQGVSTNEIQTRQAAAKATPPEFAPSTPPSSTITKVEDLPAEFGEGATAGPVITRGQGQVPEGGIATGERPKENLNAPISEEVRPRGGEEPAVRPTRTAKEGFQTGDRVKFEFKGGEEIGTVTDPGESGVRARILRENGTYTNVWPADLIPIDFDWETGAAGAAGTTPAGEKPAEAGQGAPPVANVEEVETEQTAPELPSSLKYPEFKERFEAAKAAGNDKLQSDLIRNWPDYHDKYLSETEEQSTAYEPEPLSAAERDRWSVLIKKEQKGKISDAERKELKDLSRRGTDEAYLHWLESMTDERLQRMLQENRAPTNKSRQAGLPVVDKHEQQILYVMRQRGIEPAPRTPPPTEPPKEPEPTAEEVEGTEFYYGEVAKGVKDMTTDAQAAWESGSLTSVPSKAWIAQQKPEHLLTLLDAMEAVEDLPKPVASFAESIRRHILEQAGQQGLPLSVLKTEDIEGEGHERSDVDTGELPPGRPRTSQPTGTRGPRPLGTVPAEGGKPTEEGGETGHGGPRRVVEDGVQRPPEHGEGPTVVEADGGASTPSPVAVSPTGADHDPGTPHQDYSFTADKITAIVNRGTVARVRDNIAAIDLVKKLKEDDRYATPEEQDVLAKYVGWGEKAVSDFLNDRPMADWSGNERSMWEKLRDRTTEEERKALRRGTTNQHFTFNLYEPIWEALVNAGFSRGRVLEPAIGAGHAFGFMPPDVRVRSTLSASELDPLTASIAGYLFPSATVQAVGFESILMPRGTQDLILSNFPFGDFGVEDDTYPAWLTASIHNYFFVKSLDLVRPGGLIVGITSRYTMDGLVTGRGGKVSMDKIRHYLADRADFVGAIRLPNTAFDKSAKTEVVTDLIVLRKRLEGEEPSPNNKFFETAEHPTLRQEMDFSGKRAKVYRSQWYTEHPEYILGTESLEGTMRGRGEYTVTAPREGVIESMRTALTKMLPAGTYQKATKPVRTATIAEGKFKVGELRTGEKGRIVRVAKDGEQQDATPTKKDGSPDKNAVDRLTGMIGIRDALRSVVAAMLNPDATDAAIAHEQKTLGRLYDKFVKQYGTLNSPINKRLFAADPEATNLLALEKVEATATQTKRADGTTVLTVKYSVVGKADIFTKRTLRPPTVIEKVSTPKDALLASLGQFAAIDFPYMAKVSGASEKELHEALTREGLIFEQPDGSHVLAEEYLSGDVVTKLDDAHAAMESGEKNAKRFKVNVEALGAVQPKAKTKADIESGVVALNLGAGWVDPSDIEQFAKVQMGGGGSVTISQMVSSTLVRWTIQSGSATNFVSERHPLAVKYARGANSYGFLDLLDDALNLKEPSLGYYTGSGKDRVWVPEPEATLAARANIEAVRDLWRQYTYTEEGLQERALKVFNTRYNRTVERKFDGSHLIFPGAAQLVNAKGDPLKWHQHQLNGVWRILSSGNTLLAHEVGAGKTFEMILAAMEMRRTGRARKPMITVPTYLLPQWRSDILKLYPNAKVAAFDEKDLEGKKRQTAMARIAYGDWDVVLVPHSSFGLLKASDERIIAMMERWVQELKDLEGEVDPDNVKAVERQRRKIEDKIRAKKDKLTKSSDNALTWEQLGVDALMVDEAQAFKNLFFFTKLENLRGLSRSESDRSLDLFVKIQEINEQSHYRNLVLATATPLMNSMAEVYTMQRYLQPQLLRQYGFENFDSWYAMFARAMPSTEQQPDGNYKEVRRLRDFSNLQTLSKMIRQVMDYVGWEDMPYLKLPKIEGGKIEIVQTDPHPMYPKLKEWFAKRMQNIRDTPPHYDFHKEEYIAPARPDPLTGHDTGKLDNILTIMTDAKKAAIDVRLVLGDRATDYKGSRIQAAADKMAGIYKAENSKKGVQLVFLDLGTPKEPPPLEFLKGVELADETDGGLDDSKDEMPDEGEGTPVLAEDDSEFNLYDALKRELIKRGVPSREIAYIHSAKSSAERLALFQAANEGKVRFVFASTDKGGVGMNIQTRLKAIHELDAPRAQRPGDLRQRMGRGIRQGNEYAEVRLIRYVTKGTTDEWLWGLITTKDYQIRSFMRGDATSLTEQDPSTMSLAEAQMLASGDPRTVELVDLKAKLARLDAQAAAAERAVASAHSDVQRGTQAKTALEHDLEDLKTWLKASYVPSFRGDKFTITLKGKTFTDRQQAIDAIIADARDIAESGKKDSIKIGQIGGLTIFARFDQYVRRNKDDKSVPYYEVTLSLDGKPYGGTHTAVVTMGAYEIGDIGNGMNPVAGIVNAYEKIPDREKQINADIAHEEDRIKAGQRVVAAPPAVIQEAKNARKRIAALEAELTAEGAANEARLKAEGQAEKAEKAKRAKPEDEDEEEESAMATPSMPLPKRPGKAPTTTALPVDAIIAKLTKLFSNVPVGIGHFRQQAYGIYKHGPQAVRTRTANDLQTVAHEFGHHLDLALMQGSSVHKRGPIAKELKKLGANTSLPSYTAAQIRREGAAEFFRLWLIDPAQLPVDAPLYLREFERFLHANPEIERGLMEIRDDIAAYLALPGVEQARLHIDFESGSGAVMARAQRLWTAATDAKGRADALAYLSTQWVDDLAWLDRVERDITAGNPIDITRSAYAIARLARGAAAKAETFLRDGVRLPNGVQIGSSFDAALEPIAKRLEDFAVYATAVHAKEMEAKGKTSGLSPGQIDEAITALKSPEFDKALGRLAEFHDAKRRYMVAGGMMDPKTASALGKKWPDYVPMQRIMDATTDALSNPGAGGKRLANRTSPVKRLKGSGRRVVNPLESIIRNTHAEVAAVEHNKAMLALVNLVTSEPGTGKWLEEIPEPMVPTTFRLSEVEQAIRDDLAKAGIDLPQNFDFDDIATIWTPRMFARGNERFVTVIDHGKIRWFEVHEPGLYDSIAAIGPGATEQIVTMFWKGTQTLRKFATATLGFIVSRNPPRDIATALVYSRSGFRPTDFLRGLFSALKHDEDFQLFLASGAGQAAQVGADRDLLRRRLRDLGESKFRQFLNHTILGPIDGLQALSQLLEEATRVGEFKRSLKRTGRDAAGLMQAALNARDVTQDFARMGKSVRAWNRYVAFFGARVGGYVRLAQAIREGGGGGKKPPGSPPGTPAGGASGGYSGAPKDTPGPMGFLWKGLMLSLLSILLWRLRKDDKEYSQIPAWERQDYWHIPFAGGYLRLSKPFELGTLFGTTTEAALDWLYKKDASIISSLPSNAVTKELMLTMLPTLLLPMVEVYVNYDIYRDRPIVNPDDLDLEPELQYNRWTTDTAKELGHFLHMSPAKVESLIYGYTAGIGRGVLEAGDRLPMGQRVPSPATGLERVPLVGSFYRKTATSDAQVLSDFYQARNALTGLKQSEKKYRDLGDNAAAMKLRADNVELFRQEGAIRLADSLLKLQRKTVNSIFENRNMTPEEKRKRLDTAYETMKRIAAQAVYPARLGSTMRTAEPNPRAAGGGAR